MLLQNILVAIIVLLAFMAALIPLFRKKEKKNTGCSSNCSGCPLSDAAGNEGSPGGGSCSCG